MVPAPRGHGKTGRSWLPRICFFGQWVSRLSTTGYKHDTSWQATARGRGGGMGQRRRFRILLLFIIPGWGKGTTSMGRHGSFWEQHRWSFGGVTKTSERCHSHYGGAGFPWKRKGRWTTDVCVCVFRSRQHCMATTTLFRFTAAWDTERERERKGQSGSIY